MLKILTITLGGFNYTFFAIVCILFVFLYDTLMIIAGTTKVYWKNLIYDKTYFTDLHLFVFHIVSIFLIHGYGTYKVHMQRLEVHIHQSNNHFHIW